MAGDGDVRAVEVGLLRLDVANNFGECNTCTTVGGDILVAKHMEDVGTIDTLL